MLFDDVFNINKKMFTNISRPYLCMILFTYVRVFLSYT